MTENASPLDHHEVSQAERFRELKTAIKEGIDDLKSTTKEGFHSLMVELRASREQGHIPVAVMEKILASTNEAYKEMIQSNNETFKESRKSADETYSKLLRTVCWMMAALIAWVTSMKVFLPDSQVTNNTIQAETATIPSVGPIVIKPTPAPAIITESP